MRCRPHTCGLCVILTCVHWIDKWLPTASTLCLLNLPHKQTQVVSPSYTQIKSPFPENFLAIGGCFECYTYHVMVLGWLKKEKRKKVNNSDFRLFQVCLFKIVTTHCYPGGKVRVIPFKLALLRTRITHAQRVIACALRAINLRMCVNCA